VRPQFSLLEFLFAVLFLLRELVLSLFSSAVVCYSPVGGGVWLQSYLLLLEHFAEGCVPFVLDVCF
jgi:hypothetical protein